MEAMTFIYDMMEHSRPFAEEHSNFAGKGKRLNFLLYLDSRHNQSCFLKSKHKNLTLSEKEG